MAGEPCDLTRRPCPTHYRVMDHFSHRARTAVLACSLVGACTPSKAVHPAEYIPKHAPEVVWVTAADKTVVPVADPQVARDTLTGTRKGTREPITVPLQDLHLVTVKEHDAGKTALLVGGLLVFTTVMLREYWISEQRTNA